MHLVGRIYLDTDYQGVAVVQDRPGSVPTLEGAGAVGGDATTPPDAGGLTEPRGAAVTAYPGPPPGSVCGLERWADPGQRA